VKSEEYMDTMIAAKRDFDREIMPKTRKAIQEFVAEANQEFIKTCRIEYLTMLIGELNLRIAYYAMLYKKDEGMNRIYSGQQILEAQERINKHEREIRALNGDKKGEITDEMIQRAKEYDFNNLIAFRIRSAMCPFHVGKSEALRLYPKSNTVHCFACAKSWDTIEFIRESQGKTFAEAVKYLQ